MGSIIKLLVLYKTAFWRTKNYSGEVVSDCIDGPAFNVNINLKLDFALLYINFPDLHI